MEANYTVYLNGRPVTYRDESGVIGLIERDDTALIEYVCTSVNNNEVNFLSEEDLPTLEIVRPATSRKTSSQSQSNSSSEKPIGMTESDKNQDSEDTNTQVDKPETTSKSKGVWIHKGKPTKADDEATQCMLDIRASDLYMQKFADKKSIKLQLWKDIAKKLCDMGFKVDAEKCRQKFANLQKQYIDFVRHVDRTGGERRDPPKFYDVLVIILGKKDKVTLRDIEDTFDSQYTMNLNDSSDSEMQNQNKKPNLKQQLVNQDLYSNPHPSTSTEQGSTKIVSEQSATLKSKSERPQAITKQNIFVEIKKQGEKQEKYMEKLCILLEEQNRQRDEFLNTFKTMLQPKEKTKKRKRNPSDSESD